jgi:hypothetical protein
MFLRNVVEFHHTRRRYIPQDWTLFGNRCGNLKFNWFKLFDCRRKEPSCVEKYCHMYEGLAWRIIMGSRFDDWVYWHFFTITVEYNSSHVELFLDGACFLSLYEESLTVFLVSDWSLVSGILDLCSESQYESESYVMTDGQSASLSWNKAPIWGLRPDFDRC